jgi:hypothetical protein
MHGRRGSSDNRKRKPDLAEWKKVRVARARHVEDTARSETFGNLLMMMTDEHVALSKSMHPFTNFFP